VSLAIAAVFGAVLGVAAMYAAWVHNAQGEIRQPGVVHWGYWIGIGLAWWLPWPLLVALVWLVAAFASGREVEHAGNASR
jgi:hypothetical protein